MIGLPPRESVEALADASDSRGWQARLDLGFTRGARGTRLSRRVHRGPLMVQRPFYPEGEVCHVYVLHPPGGLVGGDELSISVDVDAGAHALITTPAAGKCYRSRGDLARLTQRLRVHAGATLEWLPQENIVFDGARAQMLTHIDLATGARCLAWDMTCLGRPASNEPFTQGEWDQSVTIAIDGATFLRERLRLDEHASWRDSALRGADVLGTLYAWPADDTARAVARERIEGADTARLIAGVTCVDGLLACRLLAREARDARALLHAWWVALRPLICGRAPCAPRIWAT